MSSDGSHPAGLQVPPHDKIERIEVSMLERFWLEFYARNIPVVVTGGMDDWPAMKLWTPDYFRELLTGMEHPLRESDDEIEYAFVNHVKRVMSVSDYIAALDKDILDGARRPYFGNIPITSPEIAHWFTPILDHFKFPAVLPDRVGEELRLWIGAQGQRSTIHNDSNHGFNAQVYGRKTFFLFSPDQYQYLYTKRISDETWISEVEWVNPDLDAYPEYANAKRLEVTLEPGDMLYIPAFWWHSARAESVAININVWIFTPDIGKWIQ